MIKVSDGSSSGGSAGEGFAANVTQVAGRNHLLVIVELKTLNSFCPLTGVAYQFLETTLNFLSWGPSIMATCFFKAGKMGFLNKSTHKLVYHNQELTSFHLCHILTVKVSQCPTQTPEKGVILEVRIMRFRV